MRLSTLFATLGLALVMTLGLSAQTVRVIFVSGQASLQRPDEAALRPALKGETVIIGTRIVTGSDGRIVLTPMPGVKSIITPNTTLLLESVSENRTSATEVTHQAVLDLKEGAVVSDLQKPEGVTYDYSIRTARGLAGARGTTFTVGINAAGIQTIVVAHGTISINFTDGRSATLSLGQLSITKASGETQSVNNVTELPEADQKVAQTWAETTIAAIATALEAGIELDTEALNNALDAAKSLGITLSPETQAAVDRALTSLNDTAESLDPLKTTTDDPTPPISDIVTQPPADALALFRSRLTAGQLAVFDALPSDIQGQFVTLNDLGITAVALSPDRETGLPLTHQDLRVHLAAFIQLSDNALAFVKTLAGADLSNFDGAPDPAGWSPEAFERTLASWNSLSATERNLIVTLGAGEAIMDTSAGYISALLGSLSANDISLIRQTGWGDHLSLLAGKPTSQNILSSISELSSAALKAIKFFDISPDAANSYYVNLSELAETLGGLSASAQETLLQTGVVDAILYSSSIPSEALVPTESVSTDYAARIARALSFYGQLTTAEKTAARAIGLGDLFYNYAPGDTVGEGGNTALQRARQLTKFYIDNPGLRQAIQETGLLGEHAFTEHNDFDGSFATAALNAYNSLPARTRNYLLTSNGEFSFFSIYQASQPDNESNYGIVFRSFSQINSILSNLSSAEYGMLLDLDLSTAVFSAGDNYSESLTPYFEGSPLTVIKATLAHYAQLGVLQKNVLRELGIVGEGNVAILGSDTEGLSRLLAAYSSLPGTLRAATEQMDEYNAYYSSFGGSSGPVKDRSYFFPRGYDPDTSIYAVSFSSTRDLYVGATRYLRLSGSYSYYDPETQQYVNLPTFSVGEGRDLYLYASNLIDLYGTTFSAGIRGITMAAHTINLTDVDFPEGSRVSLNSKLGQLNFSSSYNNGKINFTNVSYGGHSLTNAGSLTSEFGANGNIAIGTLKNPAARPAYTPTANPQ